MTTLNLNADHPAASGFGYNDPKLNPWHDTDALEDFDLDLWLSLADDEDWCADYSATEWMEQLFDKHVMED